MVSDPISLLGKAIGRYGGEDITQLEHALQAAALADRSGASESLVVAALLHDVGHLLGHEVSAVAGVDRKHERVGARLLERWGFDASVVEPVRLHVDAKRFLARNADYRPTLSRESRMSLELQGGPMGDREAAAFTDDPWSECAVRLRRWDDEAKVPDLEVPGLEAYIALVSGLRSVRP